MEANDERHARPSLTSSHPLDTSRPLTPYNVPNAALAGASLAFSRPPSAVTGSTTSHNAANALTKQHDGALSAAQLQKSRPYAPPALTPAYSGSSTASYFGLKRERSGKGQELTPDWSSAVSTRAASPAPSLSSRPTADSHSASLTAATLAVARKTRPVPSRTHTSENHVLDSRAQALQRRLEERRIARELEDSMDHAQERPDMTSIESTRNLVHMFEQQSTASKPAAAARQPSLAKGHPPPIVAPKPQRTVSVQAVSPDLRRPDVPAKPKPLIPAKPTTDPNSDRPSTASGTRRERTGSIDTSKPSVPPPRRSAKIPARIARDEDSSSAPPPQLSRFGLPLPAPSKPTPQPPSSHLIPANKHRASPAPYKDTSLNMLSPHMTGDSLANAMVGANLALRSPSPMKRSRTPPPVPGPRRKQHHHNLGMDMLPLNRSRSLSPQKKQPGRLLTTLRGDESEDKLGKNRKHHFRQPNKHHEGTRERWRDYISDLERKRYEGVWAANKGLYISNPVQAEEVLNLIVKDIWMRSRLPSEKLGRIWDLVAVEDEVENQFGEVGERGGGGGRKESEGGKRRSLTREQFVVGLWLIDQVLKGRNLPHSVNASVWTSVRLMGVKVRLEGKGKDGRKLERGTAW